MAVCYCSTVVGVAVVGIRAGEPLDLYACSVQAAIPSHVRKQQASSWGRSAADLFSVALVPRLSGSAFIVIACAVVVPLYCCSQKEAEERADSVEGQLTTLQADIQTAREVSKRHLCMHASLDPDEDAFPTSIHHVTLRTALLVRMPCPMPLARGTAST